LKLGVDFLLKAIKINDENIKLQIWDFAGEERFQFLFPSYIRGSSGAIFIYDITNYKYNLTYTLNLNSKFHFFS